MLCIAPINESCPSANLFDSGIVQIRKAITVDFEKMSYFPPIFFNDFWLLKDYLVPLNSTVKELPLHLTVSGLSGLKYMLYNQAEQSFNMQVCVS